MEVYPGITMDSEIRFGKPCIKGTRIDVATIFGRFAAGDKVEDIQEDCQLTRDQIMAAIAAERRQTILRQTVERKILLAVRRRPASSDRIYRAIAARHHRRHCNP